MKFPLGRCVATPAALAALETYYAAATTLLQRHQSGDWGDLGEDDKRANEVALVRGERILSAYKLGVEKLYVITEADRSSTTIMLASEY